MNDRDSVIERLEHSFTCYSACLEDPQKHMKAISDALALLRADGCEHKNVSIAGEDSPDGPYWRCDDCQEAV